MLELYQFRHSAFCLKARMALKAKKLNYKTVDINPGLAQINVFRLSGQRKVPVLVNKDDVIADSGKIIRYLESHYPEILLIPAEPMQAAQACLIEEWADTRFAEAARRILIRSATINPDLREALLPEELPKVFRRVFTGLSYKTINKLSYSIQIDDEDKLLENLFKLSRLTESNNWLVGNSLSIADIAVAAQLSLLKFPNSSGNSLAGKGCNGFCNNPKLTALFEWRDKLEKLLLQAETKPI